MTRGQYKDNSMRLSKFILCFGISVFSLAVNAAPLSKIKFELGVGYVQWNEEIDLTRANVSTTGFANYAGPALTLDASRSSESWNYGGAVSVTGGKAVSGGFGSGITFPDGIDRIWYGTLVQPYVNYRINPNFLIGLGALARFRTIDWGSSDPSLRVEHESETAFTGTMNLKCNLTNRVNLIQTYAPLGLKGRSQWQWNLQYVF